MKLMAMMSAAAVLLIPVAVQAETVDPAAVSSTRVIYKDLDLTRAKDADVLLRRLQTAALESCGASDLSFREYQDAVRRSNCYRDSLSNAVAQVNAPALSARYDAQAAINVASN